MRSSSSHAWLSMKHSNARTVYIPVYEASLLRPADLVIGMNLGCNGKNVHIAKCGGGFQGMTVQRHVIVEEITPVITRSAQPQGDRGAKSKRCRFISKFHRWKQRPYVGIGLQTCTVHDDDNLNGLI